MNQNSNWIDWLFLGILISVAAGTCIVFTLILRSVT